MTKTVSVSREGDLWIVTLNRADKANALTSEMLNRLADIATEAKLAKAFILTGNGNVFSAGADLDAVKKGLAIDPAWERLSAAINGISGLTIAALNGTVAGGAFGMVLACDLRVAVPGAKFFYPVMKMGVAPQPSDPARMSALIGPARTKFILLAGQKVTTEDAYEWGLVDKITPSSELMETARSLTADCIGANPAHVTSIKNTV